METVEMDEKPVAIQLSTVGVIYGDLEIAQVEIRVTLKPGIRHAGSTLHNRAAALWLSQHGDDWMKFCINTQMKTIS